MRIALRRPVEQGMVRGGLIEEEQAMVSCNAGLKCMCDLVCIISDGPPLYRYRRVR